MNITEAVNAILKRYPDYGYDIFLDLSEIKDDVRILHEHENHEEDS